ncbi:hypothetical protein DWY68_12345 [Phocaeicola vulgatus]|nr:hypothetical protein DWY68_12345 [Phocaeicola vulgatus]
MATKLTIISNFCSRKGIKVMKNSTFFEILCKLRRDYRNFTVYLSNLQTGNSYSLHHFIGNN